MNALILSPMVPRERLAAARAEAEEWAAEARAARTSSAFHWSEGADEGIAGACWALAAIQSADARTLPGRIFLVAAQFLEADSAAVPMAEIVGLSEAQALVLAVRRLARGTL